MFTAKRAYPITFLENTTQELKLSRGLLMAGFVLSVLFTATVSGLATSVRSIAVPVKSVSLIGDNGKILHAIDATDAINKARIFEQQSLANLVTPPSGVAIAAYPNCECHIPIMFDQMFADNGDWTRLPSFAYDDLTVRVEWGGHADLYVGGTGSVAVVAGNATVMQLDTADVALPQGRAAALAFARTFGVSVDRYKNTANPAVANAEFPISIPTTANIRAIMLTQEDANGEPVNTIIDKVSLVENGSTRIYSNAPARSIRTDNAKVYGITQPTGVLVLDFAEDRDVSQVYRAKEKDTIDLILSTNAVAGNIRAHLMTIEPATF